jgi:hypothetical protein
MWLYLGPSYPDYPFSEELEVAEINTWIYNVLAYGADLNLGAGSSPLREGVDSTRVSLFAFAFDSLRNLIHSPCSFPFVGSRVCSQHTTGVTLPKDVVKREANRARDEELWA